MSDSATRIESCQRKDGQVRYNRHRSQCAVGECKLTGATSNYALHQFLTSSSCLDLDDGMGINAPIIQEAPETLTENGSDVGY